MSWITVGHKKKRRGGLTAFGGGCDNSSKEVALADTGARADQVNDTTKRGKTKAHSNLELPTKEGRAKRSQQGERPSARDKSSS